MKLYASEPFFRGSTEQEREYDFCIHGRIVFRIGDALLADEDKMCVSASSYRFLHTLFENHFEGGEEFLIPRSGHMMIPSEDKKSVRIFGCPNGVDFTVIREGESVAVITADRAEYRLPFAEYRDAVLSFAKQTADFYRSSPPRRFRADFDRDAYGAFAFESDSLYERASASADMIPEIPPADPAERDMCTDRDITGVSRGGISLNAYRFINFAECAYNFARLKGASGNYVGERSEGELSFTFFTSPVPTVIRFTEKDTFTPFVPKVSTVSRFRKLQRRIERYGYQTRDMS